MNELSIEPHAGLKLTTGAPRLLYVICTHPKLKVSSEKWITTSSHLLFCSFSFSFNAL
jgi:hypothetical protein